MALSANFSLKYPKMKKSIIVNFKDPIKKEAALFGQPFFWNLVLVILLYYQFLGSSIISRLYFHKVNTRCVIRNVKHSL